MALGKFILRLPAEIAEEELPRLKTTLTKVNPACSFDHPWLIDFLVIER